MRTEQLGGIEADAMIALDPRAVRPPADQRDVVIALGGDEDQVSGNGRVASDEGVCLSSRHLPFATRHHGEQRN